MHAKVRSLATLSALALAFAAPAAHAATNLIMNGNFQTTCTAANTTGSCVNGTATTTAPAQIGSVSINGTTSNYFVAGWTSAAAGNGQPGYNFVFDPTLSGSAADTSMSQYSNPSGTQGSSLYPTGTNAPNTYTVGLYLPGTSTATTTAGSLISPAGGKIIASDGAYQTGAISQTVSGLTVGTDYTLSFYWAAGQQTGFTGQTQESWGVTFGSQSYNTGLVTTPSQGFTPWQQVSTVFRATSATQVLSFLAYGLPSGGQPPFSLLDGVSLVATPEPGTWGVMMVGLLGAGAFTVLRRRRSSGTTMAA